MVAYVDWLNSCSRMVNITLMEHLVNKGQEGASGPVCFSCVDNLSGYVDYISHFTKIIQCVSRLSQRCGSTLRLRLKQFTWVLLWHTMVYYGYPPVPRHQTLLPVRR